MVIETKYEIGDKVWRMKDNKVFQDEICDIIIRVSSLGDAPPLIEESYILAVAGGGQTSDSFFPSKEELLKSL